MKKKILKYIFEKNFLEDKIYILKKVFQIQKVFFKYKFYVWKDTIFRKLLIRILWYFWICDRLCVHWWGAGSFSFLLVLEKKKYIFAGPKLLMYNWKLNLAEKKGKVNIFFNILQQIMCGWMILLVTCVIRLRFHVIHIYSLI